MECVKDTFLTNQDPQEYPGGTWTGQRVLSQDCKGTHMILKVIQTNNPME